MTEENLMGNAPLIDKLSERLKFELSSGRLYQVFLTKHSESSEAHYLPDLAKLEDFHQEEVNHYLILREVLNQMGVDPQVPTSGSEICETASIGWFQVMENPQTTFLQALEILLQSELVDNSGWELLIELTERSGLGKLAIQFQQCLDQETRHLTTIKEWVQKLTLEEGIEAVDQKFVMDENINNSKLLI